MYFENKRLLQRHAKLQGDLCWRWKVDCERLQLQTGKHFLEDLLGEDAGVWAKRSCPQSENSGGHFYTNSTTHPDSSGYKDTTTRAIKANDRNTDYADQADNTDLICESAAMFPSYKTKCSTKRHIPDFVYIFVEPKNHYTK